MQRVTATAAIATIAASGAYPWRYAAAPVPLVRCSVRGVMAARGKELHAINWKKVGFYIFIFGSLDLIYGKKTGRHVLTGK